MRNLALAKGDIVSVHKGGEIIPVVEAVVERHETNRPIPFPKYCPECDHGLKEHGVNLRCTNRKNCGATTLRVVEAFVAKLGIEGASKTSLYNWGITAPDQIIDWKPNAKYKQQIKFYEELEAKMFTAPEVELFGCLHWDGVGRKTFRKLVDHYGMQTLKQMWFDDITPKDYPAGVSQKTLDKVFAHFEHNMQIVDDIIADPRYNERVVEETATGSALAGKSFCFTGKISQPRKVYEQMVKDNGGECKSVSKNLDYLVVGEKAGGKLAKAEKLGVTILNEEQFNAMV
jgi:DNA ligase (NAD+)